MSVLKCVCFGCFRFQVIRFCFFGFLQGSPGWFPGNSRELQCVPGEFQGITRNSRRFQGAPGNPMGWLLFFSRWCRCLDLFFFDSSALGGLNFAFFGFFRIWVSWVLFLWDYSSSKWFDFCILCVLQGSSSEIQAGDSRAFHRTPGDSWRFQGTPGDFRGFQGDWRGFQKTLGPFGPFRLRCLDRGVYWLCGNMLYF